MKKRNMRLIAFSGIVCNVFIVLLTAALCVNIVGIYESVPELKYMKLTLILAVLNVIPVITAVALVVKFALGKVKKTNINEKVMRLIGNLKRLFLFQAVCTPVSVFIVGQLEDVGPPFFLILTMFIVFVSLTFALFLDVIGLALSSDSRENLTASV